MTAIPIRVADAVVAELNGNSFDIGEFVAVRSTGSWDKDFKGLNAMSVDVVYRKVGTTVNLDTRGSIRYKVPIVIAIRKRFEPASDRSEATGEITTAAVDPLDTLLIDIIEFFISKRNTIVLADEATVNWEPSEIKPMLGNEGSMRQGLYYSFVVLEFSYTKAI